MPSCSRIAERRGDVDARSKGAAGGASATLARHPDLVSGPLPSPLGSDVLVVRVRLALRRRVKLDETFDLEPVRTKQVDPVAVSEVKLDLVRVRPLVLAQSELGTHELLAHAFHRHAKRADSRVGQEHETPTGSEKARGFRNPAIGVRPQRGAVLGENEIEGRIRKRDVLSHSLDERKLDAGFALHPARRVKLGRRRVDTDDLRAATREPRGEVRRPTPQLDGVYVAHVAEDLQL